MNVPADGDQDRPRRAAAPATPTKIEPVSPWPRRRGRLLHGAVYLTTTLLLSLTFGVIALVAAEAVGLAVVAFALVVTAAIMVLTRGLDALTIAVFCATLAVAASQSSGIDFLVTGRDLLERHLPAETLQSLLQHVAGP